MPNKMALSTNWVVINVPFGAALSNVAHIQNV
jgi:hypothetical protein